MASTLIDRLDGLSSSAAIKGPVRVATTANIALYGLQTIDGVALAAGDRVLVKDQTAGYENGIYVADTGQWRRSSDFNRTRDVVTGTQTFVTNGTLYENRWFGLTSANPVSVGTSTIVFALSDNLAAATDEADRAEAEADRAEAFADSINPALFTLKTPPVLNFTTTGSLLNTNSTSMVTVGHATTPFTLNLPAPASNSGVWYEILNINAATVTVSTPSGSIVNGGSSASTYSLISGERITVKSNGTNWYVVHLSRRIGTSANDLIALNGSGQLPAVDGSLLTGIASPVPVVPYMKWGALPENLNTTTTRFFNLGMSDPGGSPTTVYRVQNAAGYTDVNLANTGAAGRDTGTQASFNNQTVYYYEIVHNTNSPTSNSIIASIQLSAGAVTLPANYVKAIRIPVAFFNHTTFGLRGFHMVGGQPWGVMYTEVDTGGTMNLATSNATAGTGNYVDLDASLWIPNNARWLELMTYFNSSTGTGDILASTPGVADNRRIATVSIANTDVVTHWKQRCSSASVFQLQVPLNIAHSTVVLGYHMSDDC